MASPFRISPAFLNSLKALFPEKSGLKNPWYIVAAVAFSASNRPEGIPTVFEHALQDIIAENTTTKDTHSNEHLLAQKLREAIFKSGLISGYSKAINGLKSLHDAMPEELKDTTINRNTGTSLADYETAGQNVWRSIYGEKSNQIQQLLDSIYPDMGWFSRAIGYGLVYGHTDIISPLETSYTLVAALIASDTPQQISWHLDGAQRVGATPEEARAVREVSIKVAELSGIQWRHAVPEVEAVQGCT